jgi:CRISPR-associated protein Csb2
MPLRLQVTIRFLGDRYHGSDWPPSPARVFQALVAGAKVGAPERSWSERHHAALAWLEGLGEPEIFARPEKKGQRYTLFVPNNSLAAEKSTKTSKPVAPRILASRSVGEADVVYRWTLEDPDWARDHIPALDEVASHLRALGWGVDFATAVAELSEASAPSGLERFRARRRAGVALRVPRPGLLDDLGQAYCAFTHRISDEGVNPSTRATLFGEVRYCRDNEAPERRSIAFELETLAGKTFAAPWDQAQTVAAWVRHAAAQALAQEELSQAWIDSYVLGHTAPDEAGRRLSFVPLPTVGYQHADGGIRRVLIVEPPEVTDDEALDLLAVKLCGWTLTDDDGTARTVLAPPKDSKRVLALYTSRAKVWQSTTPVVLHGHNANRGRISLAKTDRLLCQAFEAAGFHESGIEDIAFQTAPYWPGTGGAAAIRTPFHLNQWPRLHVRVTFREPIQGPVFAGIGRHCGLGVFAGVQ